MMFILPLIILIVYVKGCFDFFAAQQMSTAFSAIYVIVVLAIFAYFMFAKKKDTVPNGRLKAQ